MKQQSGKVGCHCERTLFVQFYPQRVEPVDMFGVRFLYLFVYNVR